MLFLGVLPLVLVSWLNLHIYLIVKKASDQMVEVVGKIQTKDLMRRNISRGRPHQREPYSEEESLKTRERFQCATLLSIIVIFGVCNLPRIILHLHEVIIIDAIK